MEQMNHEAIIEAAREYGRQLSVINVAAQTLKDAADLSAFWDDEVETRRVAQAVLAAVAPLIRAAALEEAAKVAENQPSAPLKIGAPQTWIKQQIAAALRAIKEQP
jgi:hypothetical protein